MTTHREAGNRPAQVHPLGALAARQIREKRGGLIIPPAGLAQVQAALDGMLKQPNPRRAVEALIDLASHVEQQMGAPHVADALLGVALTALPVLNAKNRRDYRRHERRAEEGVARFASAFGAGA